jgi:ABC-type amino acid transport substrate-binding protein
MVSLCQSVSIASQKVFRNLKYFFFILDSPYRTLISGAVLKLQEDGKLQKLKNKWWKTKNIGGGKCKNKNHL